MWRFVEFAMAALPTSKLMVLVMFIVLSAAMGLAQESPPPEVPESPDSARIKSFTYAGSGCPPGSAAGSISEDGEVLTLKFSDFSVSTSGNRSRTNCEVAITFQYPPDYYYSLSSVNLRGYAKLDERVTGLHKISTYVSGRPVTGHYTANLVGPYDDNYQHNGELAPVVYSECNKVRDININTEVRIDNSHNRNGTGLLDVDAKDVVFKFDIEWGLCSEDAPLP